MDLELLKFLVSTAFLTLLLVKQHIDSGKSERVHAESKDVFRAMPRFTESAVHCHTELVNLIRILATKVERIADGVSALKYQPVKENDMGQVGITNTKALLLLAGDLTAAVLAEMKRSGMSPRALAVVFEQPSLLSRLTKVVEEAPLVPAELKDLDFIEGVELGHTALEAAGKVAAALKTA